MAGCASATIVLALPLFGSFFDSAPAAAAAPELNPVVKDATDALNTITLEATRHEPQPPQRMHRECVHPPIPQWYKDALKASNDNLKEGDNDGCPPASLPTVGGSVMPTIGTYDGEARPIPRMKMADLSPIAFYKHFLRPGMPVVLTGVDGANETAWKQRVHTVMRAAKAEHALKGERDGDCGNECRERVHFANAETRARAALPLEEVPPVLNFPDPVPRDNIKRHFSEPMAPQVILTGKGGIFGGPHHYDMSCSGSFSIQYKGVKLWSIWAPWDISPSVPAHTRFEASVQQGELIFFPAAWYHGTEVVSAVSLTVAFFIESGATHGGSITGKSLWKQPYGFEFCAAGADGWRAQTAAWDFMLKDAGFDTPPAMGDGHRFGTSSSARRRARAHVDL